MSTAPARLREAPSPLPAHAATRHFHAELARLTQRMLAMGALAESLVRTAVQALEARCPASAASVVAGDPALDALEVEMDDACIHLLALQQPLARDLRLITGAMRMAGDLERIGDHAVGIAHAARELAGEPVELFPELGEMAHAAMRMLTAALDAFVRGDAALARAVCASDRWVDELQELLLRSLLGGMLEDPRRIGPYMAMVVVARHLERIGDLATNLAEEVVYLAEGAQLRTHRGAPAPAVVSTAPSPV